MPTLASSEILPLQQAPATSPWPTKAPHASSVLFWNRRIDIPFLMANKAAIISPIPRNATPWNFAKPLRELDLSRPTNGYSQGNAARAPKRIYALRTQPEGQVQAESHSLRSPFMYALLGREVHIRQAGMLAGWSQDWAKVLGHTGNWGLPNQPLL